MFFKTSHFIAALAVASSVVIAQDPIPDICIPSTATVDASTLTEIITSIAPGIPIAVEGTCPIGESCTALSSLPTLPDIPDLSLILGALSGPAGSAAPLGELGVRASNIFVMLENQQCLYPSALYVRKT